MANPNDIDLTTLGYYVPRFLHMHLHTKVPINDLNILATDERHRKLFSTFLHEYIHFLQDISTPFGILRSFLFVDSLKDIIHPVRNGKEGTFEVPVRFNDAFNTLSNLRLQQLYAGDDQAQADHIIYRGYTLEHAPAKDREGKQYQVAQYRIHYLDTSDRQEKSFLFGTRCIKEYMAHAIQSKYYPEVQHPDIPYLIAELICHAEYPIITKDPMLVVALCDVSLHTTNPAQLFFRTLERMKELGFDPISYKQVYDFAFDDVRFEGNERSFHPNGFYDHVVELILEQYDDALKSPIFEANRNWLRHLFTSMRVLRLELPDFMLHLVSPEGTLSEDLKMLSRILGTPFLTNDDNSYGFVPPEGLNPESIMPYQLLAVRQVFQVLQGKTVCDLYDFCSHRKDNDITNQHCLNAPWKRAEEPGPCPFAQLWITWGLNGRTPVNATS